MDGIYTRLTRCWKLRRLLLNINVCLHHSSMDKQIKQVDSIPGWSRSVEDAKRVMALYRDSDDEDDDDEDE